MKRFFVLTAILIIFLQTVPSTSRRETHRRANVAPVRSIRVAPTQVVVIREAEKQADNPGPPSCRGECYTPTLTINPTATINPYPINTAVPTEPYP